jgi:hypothetical protein
MPANHSNNNLAGEHYIDDKFARRRHIGPQNKNMRRSRKWDQPLAAGATAEMRYLSGPKINIGSDEGALQKRKVFDVILQPHAPELPPR